MSDAWEPRSARLLPMLRTQRTSPLLLVGIAVLVLGCGPLALVILAEMAGMVKGSNPIGLGLLAMVALPVGLVLTAMGGVQSGWGTWRTARGEPRPDFRETGRAVGMIGGGVLLVVGLGMVVFGAGNDGWFCVLIGGILFAKSSGADGE